MSKPRFTNEQVIQAIKDTKGLITMTADRLGCERETVYAYVKRSPAVAAALATERERMTDVAELALYRAIQAGEGWAIAMYLKTQGKGRGYVERHELSGPDGTPIKVYQGVDPEAI